VSWKAVGWPRWNLLDSNPLVNTSANEQIAGVMINARWMPKEKKFRNENDPRNHTK
jgi:hypothetical protein